MESLNESPKVDSISAIVRYTCNVIAEFQRAEHYKSPSGLLEMCELIQEKVSSVFEDSNMCMLHVMYENMGTCLYVQDWEGAR
jgi:SET and MYND domain-containing protein